MAMLSEKQDKVLAFVRRFTDRHGYAPTMREVTEGCGLSSTSMASYNLAALERMGLIARAENVARGIVVLDRRSTVAGDACPVCGCPGGHEL
jgi:repressor LexA